MINKDKKIRVRIAPSPTGDPHIGIGYIALFNYAFAKKNNGEIILRIEDTDQKRCSLKSEKNIINSLKWLGLSWDEGPDIGGKSGAYRQSERKNIYVKYVNKLLKLNKAYICTCSNKDLLEARKKQLILKKPTSYSGKCRNKDKKEISKEIEDGSKYVIRLKTPRNGTTTFIDLLRGSISINNEEIDDQILLKSDGFPTYHLANVIDDYLMGISHVLRGEEWISSTPKHIIIYKFLGLDPPQFCHLPLLRNFDKSKVSKRKNPTSILYYKKAGFLSDAIINFLGLMGFSLKNNNEFFTINDFIHEFSINRISLGGPIFDIKKLLWLNSEYIKKKQTNLEIINYIQKELFTKKYLNKIIPLVKNRLEKLEDFIKYTDFFFTSNIYVNVKDYTIENTNNEETIEIIDKLIQIFDSLYDFSSKNIKNILISFCLKNKIKSKYIFMYLRLIITGKTESTPLFDTLSVLGKERVQYNLREMLIKIKK